MTQPCSDQYSCSFRMMPWKLRGLRGFSELRFMGSPRLEKGFPITAPAAFRQGKVLANDDEERGMSDVAAVIGAYYAAFNAGDKRLSSIC